MKFVDKKSEAIHYLSIMRDHPDTYAYCLWRIGQALTAAGLHIEDISTSYEELCGLSVKGAKVMAKRWLKEIRKNTDKIMVYDWYLMYHVFMGRLNAKDFGATERELTVIKRIYLVQTFRRSLKKKEVS